VESPAIFSNHRKQQMTDQQKEALAPFLQMMRWPLNHLPDTDVIQCKVITPEYETGGIPRAFFGLTVADFRRLDAAFPLSSGKGE
jgi:hypothetical protein